MNGHCPLQHQAGCPKIRVRQPVLTEYPQCPLKFAGYSQEQSMLPEAMFMALELGFDMNVKISLACMSELLVTLGKSRGCFLRKQEVQRSANPSVCAASSCLLCNHPYTRGFMFSKFAF